MSENGTHELIICAVDKWYWNWFYISLVTVSSLTWINTMESWNVSTNNNGTKINWILWVKLSCVLEPKVHIFVSIKLSRRYNYANNWRENKHFKIMLCGGAAACPSMARVLCAVLCTTHNTPPLHHRITNYDVILPNVLISI